jgi:hypothetical protein
LELRNSRERERIEGELPVRSAVPTFARERLDPSLNNFFNKPIWTILAIHALAG